MPSSIIEWLQASSSPCPLLHGPRRQLDEVVVDECFSIDFESLLAEERLTLFHLQDKLREPQTQIAHYNRYPVAFGHFERVGIIKYTLDPNEWVTGVLIGESIAVAPSHQGGGYGCALVCAELATKGQLSVWDHDRISYSPSGARLLIRLGQRLLQQPALLQPTTN